VRQVHRQIEGRASHISERLGHERMHHRIPSGAKVKPIGLEQRAPSGSRVHGEEEVNESDLLCHAGNAPSSSHIRRQPIDAETATIIETIAHAVSPLARRSSQ
jgi:hypothetical protein